MVVVHNNVAHNNGAQNNVANSVERRLVLSAQDNVQLREEVAATLEQLRHRSVVLGCWDLLSRTFFIAVENVALLSRTFGC